MTVVATVPEKTTAYLTVSFLDKAGAPAIPASVTYRIDCLTTNTAILADTALTPAASIEITLTPAQNAIINQANALEAKRVTVKATYGASDALNDEYDYLVKNLSGVT